MLTMGARLKFKKKNQDINSAEVKNTTNTSGRLDLNDLLKRAKDEEKNNNKTNLLILSGTVAVAAITLLIISL